MTAHFPSPTCAEPGPPQAVRCRPIAEADVEAVVDLLVMGFPERTKDYWLRGIRRYRAVHEGAAAPRLGFVLAAGDRLVGVLLTLHGPTDRGGHAPFCNLSSWYVVPQYRPYATMLDLVAIKAKSTVYFNISAIRSTWPAHEARGFSRYARGQFVALPLLSRPRAGARVRAATPSTPMDDLRPEERRLLADHARFGCVCLIGTDARGSEPFVFIRRPVGAIQRRTGLSGVGYFQLVYGRAAEALPRFAHAIGRHLLLRHAMPLFVLDVGEARPDLVGFPVPDRGVKFSRGPATMPLGDLSYSELVLFGP